MEDVEFSFREISSVASSICSKHKSEVLQVAKHPTMSEIQRQLSSLLLSLDGDLSDKVPLSDQSDFPEIMITHL